MSDYRAAIETYVECWAKGDKARWLSLWAEDAILHDPVGDPPNDGIVAIEAFWDKVIGMGMTMTPIVHRIVVCGNEAILVFRMEATVDGAGMGVEVIDRFVFNEAGKFASMQAYWDSGCLRSISA